MKALLAYLFLRWRGYCHHLYFSDCPECERKTKEKYDRKWSRFRDRSNKAFQIVVESRLKRGQK